MLWQGLMNLLAKDPERKKFMDGLTARRSCQLYRACVNLSSTERKKGRGPFKMLWVSDLMEWAASNLVPGSKDAFERLVTDQVVVLPGFKEDIRAVAFSCRGMIENIREAKNQRPDWLNVMIDGTYKLDYIRWTLISVGTTTLRWDPTSNDLVTQFIPFGYCFADVEMRENILLLLDGLKELAARFYEIDLDDSWVKVMPLSGGV